MNQRHRETSMTVCFALTFLLALAGLGCSPDRHVGSLVQELTSQSCQRRAWVVQTLGILQDPSAIEPLRQALHDEEPSVRRGAVWALGQINNPRAMDALTEALHHEDPNVCKDAARALTRKELVPGRQRVFGETERVLEKALVR